MNGMINCRFYFFCEILQAKCLFEIYFFREALNFTVWWTSRNKMAFTIPNLQQLQHVTGTKKGNIFWA